MNYIIERGRLSFLVVVGSWLIASAVLAHLVLWFAPELRMLSRLSPLLAGKNAPGILAALVASVPVLYIFGGRVLFRRTLWEQEHPPQAV